MVAVSARLISFSQMPCPQQCARNRSSFAIGCFEPSMLKGRIVLLLRSTARTADTLPYHSRRICATTNGGARPARKLNDWPRRPRNLPVVAIEQQLCMHMRADTSYTTTVQPLFETMPSRARRCTVAAFMGWTGRMLCSVRARGVAQTKVDQG